MAKIRTLKEEMLIGGSSEEHIYPRTTTEAVYTKDNKVLQDVLDDIKDGEYLGDEVIQERHIKEQNVTTSKIKDNAVTTDKLSDSSITTSKIKDGNITNNKLADTSVGNRNLIDSSVDTRVIEDDAVTTEKIVNLSVTTDKINEHSVTEDKVAVDAVSTRTIVDKNVTERKLADNAVTTNKIKDSSITTSKVEDRAVTGDKIAKGTILIENIDDDLRNAIEAATGLPSDILERFQNMSEDIAELQDSTYPIELGLNVVYSNMVHAVNYSVKNKGVPFVGDTTLITKTLVNGTVKTLSNVPSSGGILQSNVESNREIFKLDVTAKGHTSKSISTTRYICYAGNSDSDTISEDVIKTLVVYSTPNVNYNPTVSTENNQYIWLVVPSTLSINRVTSQGFDVTLQSPQNITTSLGTFKAYRTVNPLTAQTWNLVIS